MIDIVVGGQYGSEGKGKVAYWLANKSSHKCVARVGGPNSGHTINGDILRHLPASALIQEGICIIGAGSYINIPILLEEIAKYKPHNLYIDSKAVIIDGSEPEIYKDTISSTLSGTGIGVINRVSRLKATYVGAIPKLERYIVDTAYIHEIISNGCIIEGTQGFGLSVLHSPHPPYMTSRDTTASGFISELGVSPKDVRNIYLTLRSFPIRVAGNSGPLYKETSWENIKVPPEYTSVTREVRRIGYFDFDLVKAAIRYNKPTHIVLNHLDYIPKYMRLAFIDYLRINLKYNIDYVGLSPDTVEPNPYT